MAFFSFSRWFKNTKANPWSTRREKPRSAVRPDRSRRPWLEALEDRTCPTLLYNAVPVAMTNLKRDLLHAASGKKTGSDMVYKDEAGETQGEELAAAHDAEGTAGKEDFAAGHEGSSEARTLAVCSAR